MATLHGDHVSLRGDCVSLCGDRVSLRGDHMQLRVLLQTACRTGAPLITSNQSPLPLVWDFMHELVFFYTPCSWRSDYI